MVSGRLSDARRKSAERRSTRHMGFGLIEMQENVIRIVLAEIVLLGVDDPDGGRRVAVEQGDETLGLRLCIAVEGLTDRSPGKRRARRCLTKQQSSRNMAVLNRSLSDTVLRCGTTQQEVSVTVQLMTKSLLAEVVGDRLVLRQHPRSPDFDFVVAGIKVGQCLPVGVADEIAARYLADASECGEAA
jgi:hypothetical protein